MMPRFILAFFVFFSCFVLSQNHSFEYKIHDAVQEENLLSAIRLMKKNPNSLNQKSFYSVQIFQKNFANAIIGTSIAFNFGPIHLATLKKNKEILKWLLKYGADVNLLDGEGHTALNRAIEFQMLDMVEFLLNAGADPNAGKSVRLPVHTAIERYINALNREDRVTNRKIIDLLLKHKIDLNKKEQKKGITPLSYIIDLGDLHMVKLFLSKGADINKKNDDGNTPLHLAVHNGDSKIVQLLIDEGADVHVLSNSDSDPNVLYNMKLNLPSDQERKHTKMINYPPLHYVFINGNYIDIAKILLDAGADVNQTNSEGRTILHHTVSMGLNEMTKFLLSVKGIKLNLTDAYGQTPLHFAVLNKRYELTRQILSLKKQVDINKTNPAGNTPLHLAILNGDYKMVDLILNYNPNINVQNNQGLTPLHLAVLTFDLNIINILLSKNAKLNMKSRIGRTPLHYAISLQSSDFRNSLLKSSYLNDENVLYLRNIDHDFDKKFQATTQFKIVQNLILGGANINAKDKRGFTPLHLAVSEENESLISYLLIKRARNTKNDFKSVPKDYAKGNQELLTLFNQKKLAKKKTSTQKKISSQTGQKNKSRSVCKDSF